MKKSSSSHVKDCEPLSSAARNFLLLNMNRGRKSTLLLAASFKDEMLPCVPL